MLKLLPREHGAYGQLACPLVTALAIGRPGAAAFSTVVVAVCFFLAHEPLLVLLGERGPRSARIDKRRAGLSIVILAATAAGVGVPLVALSSSPMRLALIVPAVFVLALLVMIVAGREHTVGGEIVSALAFASVALPAAIAGGAATTAAVTCASVFAAQFVSATFTVHAVIARTKQPPAMVPRLVAAGIASGLLSGLAWFAWRGMLAESTPWAALPSWLSSCVLAAVPPSAKRLRAVGWSLIATSLTSTIILIATLR